MALRLLNSFLRLLGSSSQLRHGFLQRECELPFRAALQPPQPLLTLAPHLRTLALLLLPPPPHTCRQRSKRGEWSLHLAAIPCHCLPIFPLAPLPTTSSYFPTPFQEAVSPPAPIHSPPGPCLLPTKEPFPEQQGHNSPYPCPCPLGSAFRPLPCDAPRGMPSLPAPNQRCFTVG